MKTIQFFTLFLSIIIVSCAPRQRINIVVNNAETIDVGNDLARYLLKTYPDKIFQVTNKEITGEKSIELLIVPGIENREAYQITGDDNQLLIKGKTPKAIVNGIYGLLKALGWQFYLSFEAPPIEPAPLDFSKLNIENKPPKERRIIFDWHNFLSGCTGWDYEQWEKWVDNALKIGFNTIMVHAYGNNPMQSFSYNGKKKKLGYLTTSLRGRDWGAEHVNDVRRMIGGELYPDYEFGSKAAKVKREDRDKAATSLMQKVFQHAAVKMMDVCYAIDVDTWMANPQNIINTLPEACLLQIAGYHIVNPEHPEGEKYYRAQLTELLTNYPEITMLAAWMRYPKKHMGSLGSIWLQYTSATLPEPWQIEYFDILKCHPELKDEQPYPGLFAISKIIKVYRKILDDIRPDIELVLGSWKTHYLKQSDPFLPPYCGFIPLDYDHVLDDPQSISSLAIYAKQRKLYPVVWAQHDDHRYIGRPYRPFADFNSKLDLANASGYGIIHWMTHPIDLYFNATNDQVWQNKENKTLQMAVDNFVTALVISGEPNLTTYYQDWFENAPMFGRETTDFFMRPDIKYSLDGYCSSTEVVVQARNRIKTLQMANKKALNEHGKKAFEYQLGMEKFIISFFTNHHKIHRAYKFLAENNPGSALLLVKQLNPEETINIYGETISGYGATRGEEGILLSLNLRWMPDYVDIRQRVRIEPVRINFQPTSHDTLAQGPGTFTFFIDKERNLWISIGEKELNIPAATKGILPLKEVSDSWIEISNRKDIALTTMRGFNLAAGKYQLELIGAEGNSNGSVSILQNGMDISTKLHNELLFDSDGGKLILQIIPKNRNIRIMGIIISPV